MSLSRVDLEKRFAFAKIPPEAAMTEQHRHRALQHDLLREAFISMAIFVNERNPGSRETEIALTELESASHWAHKALSRSTLAE